MFSISKLYYKIKFILFITPSSYIQTHNYNMITIFRIYIIFISNIFTLCDIKQLIAKILGIYKIQ